METNKLSSIKHSISRQFIISILAIVGALVAVIVWMTSILLTQTSDLQIRHETERTSAFIQETVEFFMNGAYNLSYELASNPVIVTMDGKKQTPILHDSVIRNDYFELLYIQNMDGMQTARSSGILGNRKERWWFQQMLETKQPFVSKSYYSVGTQMPCTSIFFPIYADDETLSFKKKNSSEMVGVFGADIKLIYIQQLIERFSDYETGSYSFIIDGEGVVLAHPDNEYLETLTNYKELTQTISQKDEYGITLVDDAGNVLTQQEPFDISADYKSILEGVMQGMSGTDIMEVDGEPFYVSYAPIQLPGKSDSWSVIALQNRSLAMSTVTELTINIVIITLMFALSAVMVILMLIGKITNPISQIAEMAAKFSVGDFHKRVSYTSQNEIGFLAKVFNQMADNIVKHMEELTNTTREKERMQSELRIATKIQKDMLPDVSSRFADNSLLDIYSFVKPALEMGGDFYDAFYIDDKQQKICLAIADVSGKGVPAAMFMVIVKALIQDYILNGGTPSDALGRANNNICKDNPDSMFVTVFLAVIDLTTGEGSYSQAGHNPIARCPKGGEFAYLDTEQTMPIGFFPDQVYPTYDFNFASGNKYFLYTDGVTEALDTNDTEWGDEALLHTLNKYRTNSCQDIIELVRAGISAHAKNAKQSDDITMLAVTSLISGEQTNDTRDQ